ncbi:hypothetical protein Q5P01_025955 [Channa striata]|uniref:Matrin-type domain-containing protein n=1 Tax=Channa striata TaxID=64152 RepID=A0AA88IFH1_CHASR|nr:hypothetical protein Q5P01_025955 [Channa striata]
METTEDGEDSPAFVQTETPGATPMEITSEMTANTTETPVKPDEQSHVDTCSPEETVSDNTPQRETEQLSTVTPATSDNQPEAFHAAFSDSPQTGAATAGSEEEKKEEDTASHSQPVEEEIVNKTKQEDRETGVPAAGMGNTKESEDKTKKEEESAKQKLQTDTPISTDYILPPFDPNKPVGMEYLVPKTGFFCKVCNRFFSGSKEAEINHCKSIKHYENLQKHFQTMKTANISAKADSS